jgi:REP element-mobilizing transposase RayT
MILPWQKRAMPRTARASIGGMCYHVINRGNARQEVFQKNGDYQVFIHLFNRACERVAMRVLGYCVMPITFIWATDAANHSSSLRNSGWRID